MKLYEDEPEYCVSCDSCGYMEYGKAEIAGKGTYWGWLCSCGHFHPAKKSNKYRVEFVEEVLHVFHEVEAEDEEEALDRALDLVNEQGYEIPHKTDGNHEMMPLRIRGRFRLSEPAPKERIDIYDAATKFENEND